MEKSKKKQETFFVFVFFTFLKKKWHGIMVLSVLNDSIEAFCVTIFSQFMSKATTKTHPISLFHEVLPADVCHDACGQSISHYINHGTESVSTGDEDIWESIKTAIKLSFSRRIGLMQTLLTMPNRLL